MEKLDLTMAKIAQDNGRNQKIERQLFEDKQKAFLDDEMEEIEKRFLSLSVKKDNKSKKQIFGKLYVGKEDFTKRIKTACKIAAALMLMYTAYKAGEIYTTVSTYNDVLETKMENELTEENINAYNYHHDNPILDGISDYINIKDVEKELKASGDYDFFSDAAVHTDNDYLGFDENSLINLSERRQDAIDIVSDQVVDEYENYSRKGI